MPLVPCPDCQHELSSEAYVCTHCGRPTEKQQREQKKLQRGLRIWLAALLVALIAYMVWLTRR